MYLLKSVHLHGAKDYHMPPTEGKWNFPAFLHTSLMLYVSAFCDAADVKAVINFVA
jgi:hypothetical protein